MTGRIGDLSLAIEDNMPAHKLFRRPVITTHRGPRSSAEAKLSARPSRSPTTSSTPRATP